MNESMPYNNTSPPLQGEKKPLNGEKFLEIEANLTCADCGKSESRWAAHGAEYAVFICIQCAGVHRSLGTHVSKVKSITLDTWTEEEIHVRH